MAVWRPALMAELRVSISASLRLPVWPQGNAHCSVEFKGFFRCNHAPLKYHGVTNGIFSLWVPA